MRVLWITGNHPVPDSTGGAAHEYELLRALSARHEIHVISAHQDYDLSRSPLKGLGITVEAVAYPISAHPTTRIGMAMAMIRADPTMLIWLLRHRIAPLRDAVVKAEAVTPVDLVHATHGDFAPVLSVASAPTSLLLFDSYTRQAERLLASEVLPRRRLQRRIELRRTRAYERRWYAPVSGLAAVSSIDAVATEDMLGRPVEVLPNPIAPEFFDRPTIERDPNTVAFIGSLEYPPNIDAINWLVDEIWPLVAREHPSAKLLVAGAGREDGWVADFADRVRASGGECWINVPDIRSCYWRASAVIAPMRLGTGVKNKVIHAMACGAPVVATRLAAEGIDVLHQRDVLLGDTAEELAAHLVATLQDPHDAALRAAAGRRVAAELETDAVVERFDAWWSVSAAIDEA